MKHFLKPNLLKIIFFVLLLTILVVFQYVSGRKELFWVRIIPPFSHLNLIQDILSNKNNDIGSDFELIYRIVFLLDWSISVAVGYITSCLIIWIYNKLKNRSQ